MVALAHRTTDVSESHSLSRRSLLLYSICPALGEPRVAFGTLALRRISCHRFRRADCAVRNSNRNNAVAGFCALPGPPLPRRLDDTLGSCRLSARLGGATSDVFFPVGKRFPRAAGGLWQTP